MAKQNNKTRALPADQKIAKDWLTVTIRKLVGNIKKVKAIDTQELVRSFSGQVGEGPKVRLEYARRGMYVDMGVGRGMPIGGARELGDKFGKHRNAKGQLHRHIRKPKKWFSREISHQTKRLAELISDQKGSIVIADITRDLPSTIHISTSK